MKRVILENKGRQPLTLLLPHETACTELECLCSRQRRTETSHDPTTGALGTRSRNARMPRSLSLFGAGRPGSTSEPLPVIVKRAPDVAKHLRPGGVLVAHEVEVVAPDMLMPAEDAALIADVVAAPEPVAEEPAPMPAPTETTDKRGSRRERG